MNVYMYVFLSRCRRLSRRLALIKSYKKKFISKSRDYLSRPRKSYKNNDMQKIHKIQSRLHLSWHRTRYRYMRCALLRGGIMFWWILYDLLSRYGTWFTHNMIRWATIMLHFFKGGGGYKKSLLSVDKLVEITPLTYQPMTEACVCILISWFCS